MSKNSDIVEVVGKVVEVLPNSTFKVKLTDIEHVLICYLGGKLKMHKIKVVIGDSVKVEMSPYDLSRGRIMFRL